MRFHRLFFLLLAGFQAIVAGTPLETAPAEFRTIPRIYRLDGVVEAANQTTISAQTRGEVQAILYDVNDYVEKGAVLIRLKDTEQRARVSQAEAELRSASAGYQEALRNYQRTREIFGKKLIAKSAMDKAEAALKTARAKKAAAQARLEQAREQLEYTRIRAPYSGIVTHRYVEVGEIATPGQKLMSGISLEQLRVNVDVPQSLIPAIRRIGKASVQLPDDGYLEARKITVFPFAQRGSNTFKVRLDLPKGTRDLFPGMFVKTAFVVGEQRQLMIPARAVVHRSEVTGVYVVAPDGRVSLRHIRAGRRDKDGMIAVLAGLEPGERVALDPIAATRAVKQQTEAHAHE